MVGVNDFAVFIQQKFPNVFIPQNLLEIAQGVAVKLPPVKTTVEGSGPRTHHQGSLCLVIDGECCLDRLYGGFFTDWACGGQWNRVVEFLRLLLSTMKSGNMEVVVFFNGALEDRRMAEWKLQQITNADRVRQVLQHVKRKRTPPPKVLWMPPAALRTCLRLTLRHCMIPVYMTVDDHKQEVMTFLREQQFDALLADGAEYLFCEPPRLFSAASLRLTFKGSLDVKELVAEDVAKCVDLHPNRFCLIPAILGNFILPPEEYAEFYEKLLPTATPEERKDPNVLLPSLIAFIRNLPNVDDIRAVGRVIFKDQEEKADLFLESVTYYANATKEGFHKYFRPKILEQSGGSHQFASDSEEQPEQHGDVPLIADGNCENNLETDEDHVEHTADGFQDGSRSETPSKSEETELSDERVLSAAICAAQSAYHSAQDSATSATGAETVGSSGAALTMHFIPAVQEEILKPAAHRHFRGLMHPWIHQILTKAELKLETNVEEGLDLPFGWKVWRGVRQSVYAILFDVNHKLFLLHQQKTRSSVKPSSVDERSQENQKQGPKHEETPVQSAVPGDEPGKYPQELSTRIFVKEWVLLPKRNLYERPEMVEAVALPWRRVPTLRKLWLEKQPQFREKRMKAFLSCFLSDAPLMMNHQYVPQHLLILCCVLRYMVAYTEHPQRILEQHELNAFLAVAVSPQRLDPNTMQSIPVQNLTPRGVQLANLFMQGVEHAVLANDACGAPVPWTFLCPWLFFDGKLFQLKLETANRKPDSLMDLCNGDLEQIGQVERMRRATVEGLEFLFSLPKPESLAFMNPSIATQVHQRLAAVARGRGMIGRREILARGGELKIGGVVVSQWGGQGDKSTHHQNNHQNRMATQATSVGAGNNRFRGGRPASMGVVRLSPVRPPPPPPPPPPPQFLVPSFRGQIVRPPPIPPPLFQMQHQGNRPPVRLYPTPFVGAPAPPPPQMGAAGYGMEALHKYQLSTRGRGRGGVNSSNQRGRNVLRPQNLIKGIGASQVLEQRNLSLHYSADGYCGSTQGNWTGT